MEALTPVVRHPRAMVSVSRMDSGASKAGALRWIVVGLTAATVYLCWPLWPALVLAAWTATLARPLLVRFERVLRGRRIAAAVLSLLLFLVLALPVGLVVLGAMSGAQELARTIAQSSSATSALEEITTSSAGPPQLPGSVPQVIDVLERIGPEGATLVKNVAGAATRGLVGLFIYFCAAFVFLLDGAAVWRWMQRHSPLEPEHLERLSSAFHETGRGLLVGVGLTSATQGLVATIIYLALGVHSWWMLGPITGLASLIPLIGTALVWGPLALSLFLKGHVLRGVILALLGVGVISLVDNLVRPIYMRMGSLKMPLLLLFISIFGGIAAIGPWGAILGPLVVRLWLEAMGLRRPAVEA